MPVPNVIITTSVKRRASSGYSSPGKPCGVKLLREAPAARRWPASPQGWRLVMTNATSRLSHSQQYFDSLSSLLVVCVTAAVSHLVPKLAGVLIANPRTVWPLWPGCAILVTGLLLVRVNVWPLLIPASFVGFAVA